MASWVTFSNGQKACQTWPANKMAAKALEIGFPHKEHSWGKRMDFVAATSEQKAAWEAARIEILNQEAQEYIDEKWPGLGVTVTDRKSLPYGSHPAFGSGDRGGHFCFTPNECAGKSACPKNYACSE